MNIKQLRENIFFKNLSLYVGGNIIGQCIGILLSPVIIRLFSPEAYGVQSVYNALVSTLMVVSTLSYQNPIPITTREEEKDLTILSALVLAVSTSIIGICISIREKWFFKLFNAEVLIPYKYFLPIGVFCIGIYNILTQYAIKHKSFFLISKTKIAQSLMGNLSKVFLGMINLGPIGLILGNIIGQSFGVRQLLSEYTHNIKSDETNRVTFMGMKRVLIRYKRFAYFTTPCNYIYTLGSQLPVLMLSSLYGTEISGYYSLAYSIVYLPCNLIGNALSQVFYSELAEKRKNKDIINIIHKILKNTILIATIPFIIIAVLAPMLFAFIYGSQWSMAGEFASIMMIQVYFYFIILPVNKVFEVYEKQEYDFLLNIIRLFVLILIFYIAKRMEMNATLAVLLFSIFGGVIYILLLIIMEYMLKNKIF